MSFFLSHSLSLFLSLFLSLSLSLSLSLWDDSPSALSKHLHIRTGRGPVSSHGRCSDFTSTYHKWLPLTRLLKNVMRGRASSWHNRLAARGAPALAVGPRGPITCRGPWGITWPAGYAESEARAMRRPRAI